MSPDHGFEIEIVRLDPLDLEAIECRDHQASFGLDGFRTHELDLLLLHSKAEILGHAGDGGELPFEDERAGGVILLRGLDRHGEEELDESTPLRVVPHQERK